jgi:hypothetical protein
VTQQTVGTYQEDAVDITAKVVSPEVTDEHDDLAGDADDLPPTGDYEDLPF